MSWSLRTLKVFVDLVYIQTENINRIVYVTLVFQQRNENIISITSALSCLTPYN